MTDYQEYIGALRKCAKEHENDRTSTGQIIVSNLCEVIADLLEDLSSSEKPNKSIEEKCPCYYCEHFEIKGWSHCKIHEDAYGDSRCNDYHKVSQDLTKVKQDSNKSEIPTSSDDCISRQDVLSEIIRFSTEEGASVECQQLYCDVNNMPPVTPQEPKPMVEIDLYSVIKQKYIEREVLDKIRAEIEQTSETIDGFLMHDGTKKTVLKIIDKYKADRSVKE